MNPVKIRRIFDQIAFLNLSHVPDEDLVTRLQYLMEDDPVCLSILGKQTVSGSQVR